MSLSFPPSYSDQVKTEYNFQEFTPYDGDEWHQMIQYILEEERLWEYRDIKGGGAMWLIVNLLPKDIQDQLQRDPQDTATKLLERVRKYCEIRLGGGWFLCISNSSNKDFRPIRCTKENLEQATCRRTFQTKRILCGACSWEGCIGNKDWYFDHKYRRYKLSTAEHAAVEEGPEVYECCMHRLILQEDWLSNFLIPNLEQFYERKKMFTPKSDLSCHKVRRKDKLCRFCWRALSNPALFDQWFESDGKLRDKCYIRKYEEHEEAREWLRRNSWVDNPDAPPGAFSSF